MPRRTSTPSSGSAYSVSLFTDWQDERSNQVWIKRRIDARGAFAAPADFFGATPADDEPPSDRRAARPRTAREQMGVPGPWHERLPHFRMGFTPSAGEELQTEYFVPRTHAVDGDAAVARLREQSGRTCMISEIRPSPPTISG